MSTREFKGNSVLKDIPNYTVIDIETTGISPRDDSIIDISALRVRDRMVSDVFSALINPGYEIPSFISELTGITNKMLESAPRIESVLPDFISFLGDDIVVGHNVNFDINFLYDNSIELLSKPLNNDFIDTMRLARKIFPNAPHHRLQDISAMLSVNYSGAHRAEQDCRITYQCYIKMIEKAIEQFGSVESMPSVSKRKQTISDPSKIDISDDIDFADKTVCLSGNFKTGTKYEIGIILVERGANIIESVNKKVDYLIVGEEGNEKWAYGQFGNKISKAMEMQAKGHHIAILRESDVILSSTK